jgi:putative DNA primase/helicase
MQSVADNNASNNGATPATDAAHDHAALNGHHANGSTPPTVTQRRDMALHYHDNHNWSVIPISSTGDKKPLIRWKPLQTERAERSEVVAYFDDFPRANVGIITGELAGIFVVETDSEEAHEWMQGKEMPHGPVAQSSKPYKLHYYLKHPGFRVANSVSQIYPNVDVRGDGGYVCAPPSRHHSGATYQWITSPDEADVPGAPEWLLKAIIEKSKPERDATAPPVVPIAPNTPNASRLQKYATAALNGEVARVKDAPDGAKHEHLRNSAISLGTFVPHGLLTVAEIEGHLFGAIADRAKDKKNALSTIQDGIRYGANFPRDLPKRAPAPMFNRTTRKAETSQDSDSDNGQDDGIDIAPGFPLTDTGNGERFISQHGRRLLYSAALGWLVWNGRYWEPDENNAIFELGKETVRNIYGEAAQTADDDERVRLSKWANGSESLARRNAMIEIAAKDGASIKVRSDELDTHRMLFNAHNCTIDLETGKTYPPRREDLSTKASSVIYDRYAEAPTFFKFLAAVTDHDLESAEFLQRFMGYTLTGLTREQCFLILYGIGSNGKSTLLNVLRWLLGPYCKQTKPDTLMKKKFGDGIPNDVAMLRGARMVTAIETNEGRQFDEAKIKEFTGGDPVTARFFRKEFFEFEPEFKLYLATNHKPQIIGDDEGIWRRVRLMPFNVSFWNPDKAEKGPAHLMADKALAEKLRDELPGILNWALEGCLEWQRDGLPEPKTVKDATAEYRTESDPVETFLSERCVREDHCITLNAQLYEAFKKWADLEEEPDLSNKAFTARMKQKGFVNRRGSGGLRVWDGVGLLTLDETADTKGAKNG